MCALVAARDATHRGSRALEGFFCYYFHIRYYPTMPRHFRPDLTEGGPYVRRHAFIVQRTAHNKKIPRWSETDACSSTLQNLYVVQGLVGWVGGGETRAITALLYMPADTYRHTDTDTHAGTPYGERTGASGWGWGERRNCQTGEISRSGNDWPFPDRASVKYHRPRTSPSPIPGPPRPLFILAPSFPTPPHHLLPLMTGNILNQRKIAVLGSRSVG